MREKAGSVKPRIHMQRICFNQKNILENVYIDNVGDFLWEVGISKEGNGGD